MTMVQHATENLHALLQKQLKDYGENEFAKVKLKISVSDA
jgi:hypothetical protein